MTYYNKLNIERYLGCEVLVVLDSGEHLVGNLQDGLINEDWQEDGEEECLGLRVGNKLRGIYLKRINYMAELSNKIYNNKAV